MLLLHSGDVSLGRYNRNECLILVDHMYIPTDNVVDIQRGINMTVVNKLFELIPSL